jgi:hypothetical protein
MVEHLTFNQVVLGSSPSRLTSKINRLDRSQEAKESGVPTLFPQIRCPGDPLQGKKTPNGQTKDTRQNN